MFALPVTRLRRLLSTSDIADTRMLAVFRSQRSKTRSRHFLIAVFSSVSFRFSARIEAADISTFTVGSPTCLGPIISEVVNVSLSWLPFGVPGRCCIPFEEPAFPFGLFTVCRPRYGIPDCSGIAFAAPGFPFLLLGTMSGRSETSLCLWVTFEAPVFAFGLFCIRSDRYDGFEDLCRPSNLDISVFAFCPPEQEHFCPWVTARLDTCCGLTGLSRPMGIQTYLR